MGLSADVVALVGCGKLARRRPNASTPSPSARAAGPIDVLAVRQLAGDKAFRDALSGHC